jgi:GNAT acetyltransferase-like protein
MPVLGSAVASEKLGPSNVRSKNTLLHSRADVNKREIYKKFCEGRRDIPIFSQPWWLDAVCEKCGWDACLVEDARGIVGAMPFCYKTDGRFAQIGMPAQTQNFMLWINYTDSVKPEARLSQEKQVITELIHQLPAFESFSLNFYHSLTNWLPFYWQGFTQTTRYTYVIDDLTDLASVFARFSHAKKKNIRRAESILQLGPELTAQEFFNHHVRSLEKQGKRINYDYPLLEGIFQATRARDCGKVFTAIDSATRVHAAIFVIWDPVQAYYLISSIDPDHRASGAATFLIQKAIADMSTRTKCFDFEGSMIEGVENSFRQFGTIQVPYFQIRKNPPAPTSLSGFLKASMEFRWNRARRTIASRFQRQ